MISLGYLELLESLSKLETNEIAAHEIWHDYVKLKYR